MSLTVFQRKLVTAVTQMIPDNLNVFNAAANGAVVLGTGEVLKDVVEKMSVGLIANLVTDRNAYAPVGTPATAKVLARMLTNSVNLSAKVGPVAITKAMMAKIETNVNSVAAEIAAQATQAIMLHYLKAGIGAGKAAIESNNNNAVYTQPARVDGVGGRIFPTLADFPLAASKFGDQASLIKSWFMDGVTWANFIAYQALPSAEQVFAIGDLQVMGDGLGRRFIISDAAADAMGAGKMLGLVPGAVAVTTNGLDMLAQEKGGNENIERWWQGEFDFNVAVKGYRLKASARTPIEGVRSFKLSDITTKDNWELDQGQVDNAPATVQDVGAVGDGDTKGRRKTQAAQEVPTRHIKETAGVLVTLTATTAS
ncbi:major capsid protein [Escherichia phage KarlBarth]|uniref:Major capsid protein n=1 Tax=Escherichia phage KarlBarth TaxID=2851981 RepID=A0AAE8B2U5_9CAUD|nr:major capsid protein [Escherichia phage KarlBarth]QXV81925.1 major capsid protein [Escherichia phage KarlBarth]